MCVAAGERESEGGQMDKDSQRRGNQTNKGAIERAAMRAAMDRNDWAGKGGTGQVNWRGQHARGPTSLVKGQLRKQLGKLPNLLFPTP